MQPQRLFVICFVVLLCPVPALLAQAKDVMLANNDLPSISGDQTSQQQREPWDLGQRQPNWTGNSTLTIENQCKHHHQFEVTPNDLPFVQIQAAKNVPVGGHQTKQLPVKFDTTGVSEGEHVGQVVVRCIDCANEPGCTQDKELIPVRMVIAKNISPNQPTETSPPPQPPPTEPQAQTQPQSPPPLPPPPQQAPLPPPPPQAQSCGPSVEQPAPDLLSLLNYKGYSAKITEYSTDAARQWQSSITVQSQFQTLLHELQKKGYSFPPNYPNARLASVVLKQGNCSTTLWVSSFRSNPKPDGTMAGITVAYDRSAPEQSLFQVHVTNVYALQPEEMPTNNPTIKFNNESWFTVQIGEAPYQSYVSPFWPVIWYRYWWYDSHRHANWYYGCYQWWWWRYRWYGRPWFWWYNWWWGYYYWWNWDYWSTWWAPYGQAYPPPE